MTAVIDRSPLVLTRREMVFACAGQCRVVDGPYAEERRLWERLEG